MTLLEALDITEPCVISCVGAGGKTSLLLSLAAALQAKGTPFLATFTTKMGYGQIERFSPAMADDFDEGMAQVRRQLSKTGYAAWFSRYGIDKVIGIPPEWIDQVHILEPALYILVEADGAKQKLLKAPAGHEPVIPACNDVTIGVLNTDAIGQPISAEIIHRPELVAAIIGKEAGQYIEARDIARLAGHQQGIFHNCAAGKKLLLLTGKGIESSAAAEIVRCLAETNHVGIEKCVLVKGFGAEMEPMQVYCL